MEAAKIITLTESDFERYGDFSLLAGLPDIPMTLEQEFLVFSYLTSQCRNTYKGYITSVQEDEEILSDPEAKLSKKARLAIELRKKEKQILAKLGSYFYKRANEALDKVVAQKEEL